jgi:hypothetical protein
MAQIISRKEKNPAAFRGGDLRAYTYKEGLRGALWKVSWQSWGDLSELVYSRQTKVRGRALFLFWRDALL